MCRRYFTVRSNSAGENLSALASFKIVESFGSLAPRSMCPIWSSFIRNASANRSRVQLLSSRNSRRRSPKRMASANDRLWNGEA